MIEFKSKRLIINHPPLMLKRDINIVIQKHVRSRSTYLKPCQKWKFRIVNREQRLWSGLQTDVLESCSL